MYYEGVIIQESLNNTAVLELVTIVATRAELVTESHKTPRLKQWTLHTIIIPPDDAAMVAQHLSDSLASNYWYADFKNSTTHYIVFPQKVFRIDRTQANEYQAATDHGQALGIPDYQLDFAPHVVQREWPVTARRRPRRGIQPLS